MASPVACLRTTLCLSARFTPTGEMARILSPRATAITLPALPLCSLKTRTHKCALAECTSRDGSNARPHPSQAAHSPTLPRRPKVLSFLTNGLLHCSSIPSSGYVICPCLAVEQKTALASAECALNLLRVNNRVRGNQEYYKAAVMICTPHAVSYSCPYRHVTLSVGGGRGGGACRRGCRLENVPPRRREAFLGRRDGIGALFVPANFDVLT